MFSWQYHHAILFALGHSLPAWGEKAALVWGGLEVGWELEGKEFAGRWMHEREAFGVQTEAGGRGRAVEGIAYDGCGEAFLMGTVQAQLMGAARERGEGYAGAALFGGDYLEGGDGRFAVFMVYELPRTVERIGSQGQRDGAFAAADDAVEQGDVALFDLSANELLLQVVVGCLVAGYDQQARGVLVEAVNDDGTIVEAAFAAQDALYRGAHRAAGHGEQAAGLADDDDVIVGIDLGEGSRKGGCCQLRVVVDAKALQHPGENGQALSAAGGVVMAVVAHLAAWRLAHPELGHAKGMQLMKVGILQELGRTAVARAARGQREARLKTGRRVVAAPYFDEVFLLSAGVEHAVLAEEPQLQVFGELFAARFEVVKVLL